MISIASSLTLQKARVSAHNIGRHARSITGAQRCASRTAERQDRHGRCRVVRNYRLARDDTRQSRGDTAVGYEYRRGLWLGRDFGGEVAE